MANWKLSCLQAIWDAFEDIVYCCLVSLKKNYTPDPFNINWLEKLFGTQNSYQ